MDESYARFEVHKTELEQRLEDALSRLDPQGAMNIAIPLTEGRWLAMGPPEYLARVADMPARGAPSQEREQTVAEAAIALLTFMRADGFSEPLGDGRWLAVGSPESLRSASDHSGMQPYLGND